MAPFRVPAAPTRPCPRCGIGLGTRAVLDVRVDECADCTGVFVPGDVMPRLLDPLDLGLEVVGTFPRGEPVPEAPIRYLRCPRCDRMMNRRLLVRGSNVIVDVCKPHGVWFDAFELRRVAELAASVDAAVPSVPDQAWRREHAERAARDLEVLAAPPSRLSRVIGFLLDLVADKGPR